LNIANEKLVELKQQQKQKADLENLKKKKAKALEKL